MPKWHVLGSNILLPWSKLLLFYHMLRLSGHNLAHWLSKYGFWTSCISFTWELVRNTNSQAPPQTSVQFSGSVMSDSATPWTAAHQASLSIINSQNLLKLMSTESVMPSNHLLLCRPLLLLPSIFPSIRVFSNESVLHIRWPKYGNTNSSRGSLTVMVNHFRLFATSWTIQSLEFSRPEYWSG